LTAIAAEAARIRKAFELAASEFFKFTALIERIVFAVFRTSSILWLLYFIFIRHWHPDGSRDFVLSIVSGVILLAHLIEITKKVIKRRS